MENTNLKKTFHWIVEILNRHNIPFYVGGGLAAQAYGSKRPLNDIDLVANENQFATMMPDIGQYVTFGPGRYQDKEWDITLLTLRYDGQEIDIAGASNKKYFSKQAREWIEFPGDFKNTEQKYIYGLLVSVIAKEQLIMYKKGLGRHVDILDLAEIN